MGILVYLLCKDYFIGVFMMNNKLNNFYIDVVIVNFEMGFDCFLYFVFDGFVIYDFGIVCEQYKFFLYVYEYWFYYFEGCNDLVEDIWYYFLWFFDLLIKCVRWYDISEFVFCLWYYNLYCLFELGVKLFFQLSFNIIDIYGDYFIYVVVINMCKLLFEVMCFLISLGLDINGRIWFRQVLLYRCI